MIQLRALDGEVFTPPEEFPFIEILDDKSKVALLLFVDEQGAIVLLNRKDDRLQEYIELYGLDSAELVSLEETD